MIADLDPAKKIDIFNSIVFDSVGDANPAPATLPSGVVAGVEEGLDFHIEGSAALDILDGKAVIVASGTPGVSIQMGKAYTKTGESNGHVLLGGFDGDATAYRMLSEGYLDATGVQDVYFEVDACVQAILDQRAGKPAQEIIKDPGFVIHQGNLKEKAPRMWGANVKK